MLNRLSTYPLVFPKFSQATDKMKNFSIDITLPMSRFSFLSTRYVGYTFLPQLNLSNRDYLGLVFPLIFEQFSIQMINVNERFNFVSNFYIFSQNVKE